MASEGGGRVKAWEKEVLQNLAIWLRCGANYNSYHELHDAFIAGMDPAARALVPEAMYPLGKAFCKFMWEQRPQQTRKQIQNTRGVLAEAQAVHDINMFARQMWPTANKVRTMVYGALAASLGEIGVSASSREQELAQEEAIKLSFARWAIKGRPEDVEVDT
eukprot:SAG22_NODE_1180_length_5238_cov_2.463125_6_plen_162_part_00